MTERRATITASKGKSLAWLVTVVSLAVGVLGCSEWTVPACRQSYSKRGDRQAISELVREFRRTVRVVQREKNIILLRESQGIVAAVDFVAMEDWVCRAQKQYGSP